MNKKCQVFTPSNYAEKLLDSIGYIKDIYGKKILENSCGDGNILAIVVQRYIDECRANGLSNLQIRCGLERDVYGVEIDSKQHKKCIKKLNDIVNENNIPLVSWNIKNEDYLRSRECIQYDFIVGNPPYITYRELEKSEQEYLKANFDSCKRGKFDYCYAFIEKSIASLSVNGKMAYLIPSSVFKTVFGKKIRSIMLPMIKKIIDYTRDNLFQKALVKSSIIVIDKSVVDNQIKYCDCTLNTVRGISRDLLGNKWNFYDSNVGGRRFGDYFKVAHVVATLCNKAFVIKTWEKDNNGNYLCGDHILEANVIRNAVSPKNRRANCEEKIIFPYAYTKQHQLVRYTESEFSVKFPGAYRYLEQYKDDLKKRDSDKAALWFEYGRSQALNNLDCEKVLISTIVSQEVPIYKLNKTSIPYAGMYITPITEELNIDDCIEVLSQNKFLRYVKNVGIPINGNSVRITSRDVEEFLF